MKSLFVLSFFLSCNLYAGLLADYDKRCDSLLASPAVINPHKNPEIQYYFDRRIPKNIHQIWFGNQAKIDRFKTNQWKKYSEDFFYQYKLWTEKDDTQLSKIMKPSNFHLMQLLRTNKNYCAASDIVRYELLKEYGGIYIDCDFSPPTEGNQFIDLEKLVSMNGLNLVTEHDARNIGTSAIFVMNGIIMSCPHHPVIKHVVNCVYDNAMHWTSTQNNYNAPFITGPFFFNKALSGNFNVIPINYIKKFNMY